MRPGRSRRRWRAIDLALQPRQGLGRHHPAVFEQADIFQPLPVDHRRHRDLVIVDRADPADGETGRQHAAAPRGDHPLADRHARVQRQEDQARLARVVAGEDRLIARRLDHHRHARVEVGQQQDARAAPADLDHAPDQAALVDRRHALDHAPLGAGIDQHGVHERPAGVRDHARRHRGRRRDPGLEIEQLAQRRVLQRKLPRPVLPLQQALVLGAQMRVLLAQGEQLADLGSEPGARR